MRKDKEKALNLRVKGLSYAQIGAELGIPKSTLSGWLKDNEFSRLLKEKLAAKASLKNKDKAHLISNANRKRWKEWHAKCRSKAELEFEGLSADPLFIAGLMLYWVAGDKNKKSSYIKFSSGDPQTIRMFYKFLTGPAGITEAKINARLILYPDLIKDVQINFWSKATGMPVDSFGKPSFLFNKQIKRRRSFGTCSLTVYGRNEKERFLKWLEMVQEHLLLKKNLS
jgi:transcriptional regulator with XRE-family HTH domain